MLPGGLQVVGLFAVGPADMLNVSQAKLRQVTVIRSYGVDNKQSDQCFIAIWVCYCGVMAKWYFYVHVDASNLVFKSMAGVVYVVADQYSKLNVM